MQELNQAVFVIHDKNPREGTYKMVDQRNSIFYQFIREASELKAQTKLIEEKTQSKLDVVDR